MKFILVIFYLTLSLSSFLKAEVSSDLEATKSAVNYLKMLTSDKYDLTENTALSRHCELSRRKEIRTQLEFYRKTNLATGDVYTLEEVQTKGPLSALLLRAENPASPLSIRIHALAMIKRNDQWLPAPLPGSFSNTGYGYDIQLEKIAQTLERWMAREKINREIGARKKAAQTILTKISHSEKTLELSKKTPEQATLQLIEALRSQDTIQALALMGTASEATTIPLETSIDYITRGLAITDIDNEWSFVTNQSVITQLMQVDQRKKEVVVGFWNPLNSKPEKVLYFPFSQSESKTFIKLPKLLKIALLSKHDPWQQRWRHQRGNEAALSKKIPAEIFKHNQAILHQDKQKLLADIIQFHKRQNFTQFVSLLPRTGEFFGKEINQHKCLLEVSQLWKDLSKIKTDSIQPFDIIKDDHIALLPIQVKKISLSKNSSIIKIWMTQLNDVWHLVPEKILTESEGPATQSKMQALVKKMKSAQQEQQDKEARQFIERVTILTPPIKLDRSSEEDAQKTLTQFLTFLHTGDTASLLKQCAILKGTSAQQTLKILSYAIRGAADQINAHRKILGTQQVGKWTGISLRTHSKSSKVADYPLYLIVNTSKGNKLLLDADLRHPVNRGRALLNTQTWKQLADTLAETDLTSVKSLYENHLKLSSEDILKNNQDEAK